MLGRILNTKQKELLAEERRLLGDLQMALAKWDAPQADQATLVRSIRQLDELFLLVVVGEFNSGKSALINALLGQAVVAEGVTPTTTRVNLLRHGEAIERSMLEAGVEQISAPLELLREISIVDTPGTNAIQREHEAITQEFVPRSDLVLFVTSADRPFTESERSFLERIRSWGKKVVVILNKIDILEAPEQVGEVEAFIAENVHALLGFTPEVFPVSARQAQRAKLAGDQALLETSRLPALERNIMAALDEGERVRLKLQNPIGVGLRLADDALAVVDERLELLHDDLTTSDDIERQLTVYRQDMQRDFRYRLAEVDGALQGFENRGITYFDETIRLARIFDLLSKARLRAGFARRVVDDVPQVVEQRALALIDWLVEGELHQWRAVTAHLAERRARRADRVVGERGASFTNDCDRLLDSVGRATRDAADGYDRIAEAGRLCVSLQMAVAQTALVEVGAIGLGVVLARVFSAALLDLTGILAAGSLAVLGLFVIPSRQCRAKQELRDKIAGLHKTLTTALSDEFNHELERGLQRMAAAVAPYTRFVRAEQERLLEMQRELQGIRTDLVQLEMEIG